MCALLCAGVLQMQHGQVVLRQHMPVLGCRGKVVEGLLRVLLHPQPIEMHDAQVEPRIHMHLQHPGRDVRQGIQDLQPQALSKIAV